MPIGILGSLAICTMLYVLFPHALSGDATAHDFRTVGKEASVTVAIATATSALLAVVALLAGLVPARQASRVDPMVVLRNE